MDKKTSIAIDGPSGAGKSTLARMTAREFGFIYVDTGAIYRAVGLYAARKDAAPSDESAVEPLLPFIKVELRYNEEGVQRTFLNGEDVSEEIRMPEISHYASEVSALPAVRAFLLDMQREAARLSDVVMDGRDIGTVVLPDADVKIFLTASDDARAQRRYLEIKEKGGNDTYDQVLSAMQIRDKNDIGRAAAPLKPAEDSIWLDTTNLSLEESYLKISEIIREKLNG